MICFELAPFHDGAPLQGKLLGQGAYGSVHMGMKGDGTMLAVKRLDLSSDKGKHISDTYETEKSVGTEIESQRARERGGEGA